MIEIPLTQGQVALIDDEDYELVSKYKWYAERDGNTYYAVSHTSRKTPPRKHIRMHRLITGAQKDQLVDHINFNGLDNRKENLRFATVAENSHRQVITKGKSKYRGVCWSKQQTKWIARIRFNNKRIFLGYFDDEIEAAKAYDRASKKYYGSFGFLNYYE